MPRNDIIKCPVAEPSGVIWCVINHIYLESLTIGGCEYAIFRVTVAVGHFILTVIDCRLH